MFSNKNLAYILTALEAIEKIILYTSDFQDPEDFYEANDQLNFNGTYNLLLTIGEETRKIEARLKKDFSEIPWHRIKGLRNYLAHDYRGTDPEIIFDITKNYLPGLKTVLIKMVDLLSIDADKLNSIPIKPVLQAH